MPKVKLDHYLCSTATCEPGRRKTDFWDTITSGFVLEVRSTGGRTYYLRYFDQNGRQRQQKIGGFNDISFDQARKKAKLLRSQVVLGDDPAGEKEVRKSIPTYAALAEQHLVHAKSYQKSYSSTEINMRRHILPRWGKLRLNEITPQEIAKWLAEKAGEGLQPATVERIRAVFSRSFELGRTWQVPGCEQNPVRSVPRRRFSNARHRYLSAGEAARLMRAVENSVNPQLKPIVQLLLLTGARVSELLHAEWTNVDLERRAWFIPTSKTGRARHVPLAQSAIEVIEKLPTWDGCPYLVPNPETKKPFVSIKRTWQTARKEARLSDLHIHDLRHSFASFAVNAGVNLYAVGKILGHSDLKSTQRYSHLANETLMAAVEAGAKLQRAQSNI